MKKKISVIVISVVSCLIVHAFEFHVPEAYDKHIAERRAEWMKCADKVHPTLYRENVNPVGTVRVVRDEKAFQGVRAETCTDGFGVRSFILDFGRHITGYFNFRIKPGTKQLDHPLRLRFVFGETLAEMANDPDAQKCSLSRAWFQDEIINVDECPAEIRLPRRYAFRYVRCDVVEYELASKKFVFDGFSAEAVTSANSARLCAYAAPDDRSRRIDDVAVATLRDCMQDFFEDGPKRDRRLWLGDLRLQALANYETYGNLDLVKRCLYWHAGLSESDCIVRTDVYGRPSPHRGDCTILDYTAIFAATVLEYLEAGGERAVAEDLWPIALKQLELTLKYVNDDGLFVRSPVWCFIDWDDKLDRQAPEHGAILYGLKRTIELAEKLGRQSDVAALEPFVTKMENAARTAFWDDSRRLFVSGGKRQISMASQIWMTLAGVVKGKDAQDALLNAAQTDGVRRPKTPYLNTYWVWALDVCGLRADAHKLLMEYWGGMVDRGADTFWECYDPQDDFLSPYGNYLINSMCHAWSCAPCYFLRRWQLTQ